MDAMPPRLGSAVRLLAQHAGVGHLMARGTAFLLPFSGRVRCCASSSAVRNNGGLQSNYGRRPTGLKKQMSIYKF